MGSEVLAFSCTHRCGQSFTFFGFLTWVPLFLVPTAVSLHVGLLKAPLNNPPPHLRSVTIFFQFGLYSIYIKYTEVEIDIFLCDLSLPNTNGSSQALYLNSQFKKSSGKLVSGDDWMRDWTPLSLLVIILICIGYSLFLIKYYLIKDSFTFYIYII